MELCQNCIKFIGKAALLGVMESVTTFSFWWFVWLGFVWECKGSVYVAI